jgi:Uma2 family endonuclease
MIQVIPARMTAEAFIAQYGDDDRYELMDGELIEMEPTGRNEQVAAFILRKVNVQIDQGDTAWFTPLRCLINLLGSNMVWCRSLHPHLISVGNASRNGNRPSQLHLQHLCDA